MNIKKIKGSMAFLKRAMKQLPKDGNFKYASLILKGFTPDKGYLYDFQHYDSSLYLTDYWRYVNTHEINARFSTLFNDKLVSYYFLRSFTDRVVPILGFIKDAGLHQVLPNEENLKVKNEWGKEKLPVIIKDKNGWGGHGVKSAQLVDGILYDNNFDKLNLKKYTNYIVVPKLYNADYASSIYPHTLNTIRILTGVDGADVFIIRAIQRFGNDSTGSVDNFSSGGISADIDIEKGIVNSVIYRTKGVKYMPDVHPSTQKQIKGITIPNWSDVRYFVEKLHSEMLFVKYIGWDIAICEDGLYVIEANHISDIDIMQVHSPLLTNNTVKDFFKKNFR